MAMSCARSCGSSFHSIGAPSFLPVPHRYSHSDMKGVVLFYIAIVGCIRVSKQYIFGCSRVLGAKL